MSDNWITIVPRQPEFIPLTKNTHAAKCILKKLAPEADDLKIIEHEHVQLFDCGANLETVSCPRCNSDLDPEWWRQTMSEDFDANTGFQLNEFNVPCCSLYFSLNKLDYDFHQAFGRFALSAMNPDIGFLTCDDIKGIEEALGCGVSVVYRHI